MAKHEVTYDRDGLSLDDPWSLDNYFHEDGLSRADIDRAKESVLSWLQEYETAGCDLDDALGELGVQQEVPHVSG